MDPKHPEITVKLTGKDGNAFAIMGAVAGAMRKAGLPKAEIDAYTSESTEGDYDHLLRVAMATVTVK